MRRLVMYKKTYAILLLPFIIFINGHVLAEKPPNPYWHVAPQSSRDSGWCSMLEDLIISGGMKKAIEDAINAGGPCDEIAQCILQMGGYNPYNAIKAIIGACDDVDQVIAVANELGVSEAVIARAVSDANEEAGEDGLAFTPSVLGPLDLIDFGLPGGSVPSPPVSPSGF